MWKTVDVRILLLVLSFFTSMKTTTLLSDQKKCGDPECETSIIRVQAIKDYIGPDCRYLSFKSGEEIMVYFKLSGKSEDLWAGSKGKDFGYFPMDAVQIEEVFVTEEVEVPTKETDFLCLDGGEYIFENKDSIFNTEDKENEYITLYTDEIHSKLNKPKDEAPEITDISFTKEYKELFLDSDESDSKSKDQHTLETTRHGNSELRNRMTEVDKNIQQEDQKSQSLKPVSEEATWSVSGIAGWLGLGGQPKEEPTREISETVEQITFRHRKIAITDDSDLKKLNDDSETEPKTWFPSTLTDLMHFGSSKAGFGLLYKENDPDAQDLSRITGDSDHRDSTTVSDTQEQEPSDSALSKSNWFDLDISDILTFGYSNENEVRKEKYEGGEATSKNKESLPPSVYSVGILMDQGLEKRTSESAVLHEEQEKHVQETTGIKKTDSKVQLANEVTGFKDATDTSVSTETGDKLLESLYTEHGSVSGSKVMENIDTKAIMKESERKNDQSGTIHTGQLSDGTSTERNRLNSDKKLNSGHYSETNKIPPVNTEEKICTSEDSGQLNLKERVLLRNIMTQNSTFKYEREWLFQIVLYLNDICDLMKSAFSYMMFMSRKVVAALPENVTPGPNLYGFPWEMVICFAIVALLIVLLLMYRSYQSVRSRLYVGREKQLASKVAELVEDKCKVLEKLSLCKKEYEELENSLKDASLLNEATSASNMKTVCEELSSSNSVLKREMECLEKELEEEKSKRSQQDDLMSEMQRRMESLENETKSIYQQIAEAKTTLKVYDINRERLRTSIQDAVEENSHLCESEKQLLQEAEGWGERFNELNEQTKMFESSKADMEESLTNKDSQVKSLTERLLKMKDWSCAIGEHDDIEDNYWDNDKKEETENGEHLDDQEKRTVRKLIYAAKLNACLKSLETEKNQIYSKLTDENKAKEELAERIENLHREHVVLQSENTQFESEVQKLQQKLKVMTELYQENEMNLHRKLTVEEKERLQKEEKLSKADKRINHAAEELATYRQRAKDLEDELERTVRSYQNQIMSHEKKAHDNWLAARAAERHLNDIRKENLHCRQQLTEAEFKYDFLEKDPYALDVPIRAFGREQSPYGPSPMGRPSSETRAFLSPPTLLEGPLRLSPVLPGGGGRGSRGPGNAGIYEAGNEREELSSDRLSNPHRPPSDSGSLSPPWDRDRRIMPLPAGQPYNDQSLPPRRQERFYPNLPTSGRLSGPAELRSYNMHSFDKTDGHTAENNSRMDLSGNGIKDHPNDSDMLNASDQPLAPESETFGPGIVPPPLPLLRAPLMPIDPRGPFMRRGPPFPPLPPTGVYGPREYFPRDFASLPRPSLPMRTPFPLRPFSQYPPPRAGFFPPPPPPPQAPLDNSNELPAGLTQQSTSSPADHQEPQPET
ncbi:melanoma inhibitory activity protein 2 isoform X2 [Eublepharis macularius]|uniref:Melanoma inhibitory activity protein 2 n=1 Tax=Eublepharis macularius TaxID=481883 RepID=A0AA97KNN9_EUBMA|nr:melanoma inhibitory activity protein 2 isoform X2 [Eublepharis macularius]